MVPGELLVLHRVSGFLWRSAVVAVEHRTTSVGKAVGPGVCRGNPLRHPAGEA